MTQSKSQKVRIREMHELEPDGSVWFAVAVEVHVALFVWQEIKRWEVPDSEFYPEDVTYARLRAVELRDEITGNDNVE